MLDKGDKEAIDTFRGNPELSYDSYLRYIVNPLKKSGYKFVKMEDLLDKDIPSSSDEPSIILFLVLFGTI